MPGNDVLLTHIPALRRQDTLPWPPGQEDAPRPTYTQPPRLTQQSAAATQTGDILPGSEGVPMPIHRPTGTQMDFQPWSTMPSLQFSSVHSRSVMVTSLCLYVCLAPLASTPRIKLTKCRLQAQSAAMYGQDLCRPAWSFSHRMLCHPVCNVVNFTHRLSLRICLVPMGTQSNFCSAHRRRTPDRLTTSA